MSKRQLAGLGKIRRVENRFYERHRASRWTHLKILSRFFYAGTTLYPNLVPCPNNRAARAADRALLQNQPWPQSIPAARRKKTSPRSPLARPLLETQRCCERDDAAQHSRRCLINKDSVD